MRPSPKRLAVILMLDQDSVPVVVECLCGATHVYILTPAPLTGAGVRRTPVRPPSRVRPRTRSQAQERSKKRPSRSPAKGSK